MASIDNAAISTLDLQADNYMVNGMEDGPCLLRKIISRSYVDTNTQMDVIRASISHLDSKIKDMKFDVKAFNKYVVLQVDKITAYGIICMELLSNLFKAYKAVPDMEMSQQILLHST
jgi:hypothetical protein